MASKSYKTKVKGVKHLNHKINGKSKIKISKAKGSRTFAKRVNLKVKKHKNVVAALKGHGINRKAMHSRTTRKPTIKEKREDYAREAAVKNTENISRIISEIVNDNDISEYLKKNVSKKAIDIIKLLSTPRTDEYITDALEIKINAVRRILNILQGYGITNYNISKNVDGWLSFEWYINASKAAQFLEFVKNEVNMKNKIDDSCNDYFICDNCYIDNRLIFTFDAAYEAGFRCVCNKPLRRIDKADAESLISKSRETNKSVVEL